jgi:hypothetical protein
MQKVLSVKQPWASLIVLGIKDVENRFWHTSHLGRLLIHASKEWDNYDCNNPLTIFKERQLETLSKPENIEWKNKIFRKVMG